MGRGLCDAVVGAVAPSQGRDGRPIGVDAALPEADQLRIVEDPVFPIRRRNGPASHAGDFVRPQPPGAVGIRGAHAIGRREGLPPLPSGLGDRRHAAVRRVGQDRVPVPAVDGEDDCAHVEEREGIGAGDPAVAVAAGRRGRTIRVAGDALLGDPRGHRLLDSPGLLRAHVGVVAVVRVAREGRQRVDRVGAGEIRLAARHSRDVALRGRQGERHELGRFRAAAGGSRDHLAAGGHDDVLAALVQVGHRHSVQGGLGLHLREELAGGLVVGLEVAAPGGAGVPARPLRHVGDQESPRDEESALAVAARGAAAERAEIEML